MLKIVTKKNKHVLKYRDAEFDVELNTREERRELVKKHEFYEKVQIGPDPEKDIKWEKRLNTLGLMSCEIDTQVKDWRGIEGNPPCNSENKRLMVDHQENEHLCTFLVSEMANLGNAIEEEEKEKVKN